MNRTFWITCALTLFTATQGVASTLYWNLFNVEGERNLSAQFVTYNSLLDMLNDTNRLGVFTPNGPGSSEKNIVGTGSDGTNFWNLFNVEGERNLSAQFVTYATGTDMLNDTNRLGVFSPDGPGSSEKNIVGTGSDGTNYWNLFNVEGERNLSAQFVTYDSHLDMLNDTNRLGVFSPDGPGSSEKNIVGSGSDGTNYWNLFNVEDERNLSAQFVTYNSLLDMLNDTNRLGVFSPNGPGSSEKNIIGTGAFIVRDRVQPVPLPAGLPLLLGALLLLVTVRPGKRSG